MSKWSAMRLLNIDLSKFGLVLENVFPFLIINSKEGLGAETVLSHPQISFFNFAQAEPLSRFDAAGFPSNTAKLMLSELSMIGGKGNSQGGLAATKSVFFLCHEMIMVFRRQIAEYLAPTLFCLKVVDPVAKPNYTLGDIFDKELFKQVSRQLSLVESEQFCQMLTETSMLVRFVDKSFQALHQKHRLGQQFSAPDSDFYRTLKTLVNIFEVMPTGKANSKYFFKFEVGTMYSNIAFREQEKSRFEKAVGEREEVDVDLDELFDFYFAQEAERKASDFLPASVVSATGRSLTDVSAKTGQSRQSQTRSGEPFAVSKKVGEDYFRAFKEDRIVNLNEKEVVEIGNDFDAATDIF